MKKTFIIIILFALPVTIYIIFGSAAHNFVRLPILTEAIQSLENFDTDQEEPLTYEEYATVLCIYGKDIQTFRGNAFNLNERIYKKNYIYKDFQVVVMVEESMKEEAQKLLDDLHEFTGVNISKWKLAYADEDQIQSFFDSLETDLSLNDKKGTPYAFIIDKEGNLRGRKKNAKDTDKTLYGYETHSIAGLNNTMVDDVNVLLAEYRFKLKKNEKDDHLKHTQ